MKRPFIASLLALLAHIVAGSVPAPVGEWTQHLRQRSNASINAIAGSADEYLAVGDYGTFWRSADGRTWSLQLAAAPYSFTEVIWTGQHWLAVANLPGGSDREVLLRLEDGCRWAEVFVFENERSFRDFAVGADGEVMILTSTDAHGDYEGTIHWVAADGEATRHPLDVEFRPEQATRIGDRYLVAGTYSGTRDDAAGIWIIDGHGILSKRMGLDPERQTDLRFIWLGPDGDRWVALSSGSSGLQTYVSEDGVNWGQTRKPFQSGPFMNDDMKAYRFSGGRWCLIRSDEEVAWVRLSFSRNLTHWYSLSLPRLGELNTIVQVGEGFVGGTASGSFYRTEGFQDWELLHARAFPEDFHAGAPLPDGGFAVLSSRALEEAPEDEALRGPGRALSLYRLSEGLERLSHGPLYLEGTETVGECTTVEVPLPFPPYSRSERVCGSFPRYEPAQLFASGGSLYARMGSILHEWAADAGWQWLPLYERSPIVPFEGAFYVFNRPTYYLPFTEREYVGRTSSLQRTFVDFSKPPVSGDLVATADHLFCLSGLRPGFSGDATTRVSVSTDGRRWQDLDLELDGGGTVMPGHWVAGSRKVAAWVLSGRSAGGPHKLFVFDAAGVLHESLITFRPEIGAFFDGQWVLFGESETGRGFFSSIDGDHWNFQECRMQIEQLVPDEERLLALGPGGLVMSVAAKTAPEMRAVFEDPYLLESGWTGTGWFGDMWHEPSLFPWVYHWHHGWIQLPQKSHSGGTWFWDMELDWTWVHRDFPFFMYSLRRGSWLYFDRDRSTPGGPRWFYEYGGGWMKVGG